MLDAAQKSVDASVKGLEQTEEESRVVRERFQAGRGIQLEVLDAQVALTRARFIVIVQRNDLHFGHRLQHRHIRWVIQRMPVIHTNGGDASGWAHDSGAAQVIVFIEFS